eukprot:Em0005g470a
MQEIKATAASGKLQILGSMSQKHEGTKLRRLMTSLFQPYLLKQDPVFKIHWNSSNPHPENKAVSLNSGKASWSGWN